MFSVTISIVTLSYGIQRRKREGHCAERTAAGMRSGAMGLTGNAGLIYYALLKSICLNENITHNLVEQSGEMPKDPPMGVLP